MSDKKMEKKPTSILRSRKSINQSDLNDFNSEVIPARDARRVRFASINFVKPFAADPEKNTIWDTTIEEEVNHTDSTSETKGFLDTHSVNALTFNKRKEETGPPFVIWEVDNPENNSVRYMCLNTTNIDESNKENYVPLIVKNPFVAGDNSSKVTKRERVRRPNIRLSKILQPNNAVTLANQVLRLTNTSYTVDELSQKYDGNQFKATLLYKGVEHVGYGRKKIDAKNTAAVAALKHYVKTNKLIEVKKDDEGNEKMDVSEDDATQAPLSWQHIASFAVYKLFCSWEEDLNVSQNQSIPSGEKLHKSKPAKKMPENPDELGAVLLVNNMLPQAQFEDIGKTVQIPHVFSFKCIVDGESFTGTGFNKKAAKTMAAIGACSKILGIQFSPDGYVPTK